MAVIACDKREAFAQGSDSDEAIHSSAAVPNWIASRSLSSGALARDPLARNDMQRVAGFLVEQTRHRFFRSGTARWLPQISTVGRIEP
jgi:hypothetical protein